MRLPIQDDILCAGVVVGVITALALLAKMTRNDRATAPRLTRSAKDLMQQALTWLDMCNSHTDLPYKLQTATLATAYCNAARTLASDDELARACNVDVHEKLRVMETLQRKVLAQMQKDVAKKGKGGAIKARGTTIDTGSIGGAVGGVNWLS